MSSHYDAIIIGGGFYGASIALYVQQAWKQKRVLIIEREDALLKRASYNNQARVHNGYHYPRSFTTAYRSRINLPRFVQEWPFVVQKDFTKLYAIAKRNSKVTAKQFTRFCTQIGASLQAAPAELRAMFNKDLIEDVFLAEEYTFDAQKIATWAAEEIEKANIDVLFNNTVCRVAKETAGNQVQLKNGDSYSCRYLFNCTYSGLNQLEGDFGNLQSALKQEIAEMALIDVPPELKNIGLTVMDGPFFSMMPFPSRGLHTLSHVRYTPHTFWLDQKGMNPYERLHQYERETRVDRMIRDVRRYLPAITKSTYKDSLFEVKTVLIKNEGDDGRPILFEKHPVLEGCYSVLGGKIDNIYDVLLCLQQERPV